MSDGLIGKIRKKQARIVVVGLGHVGLPTAAIFADTGYMVIGADIRKEVVKTISSLKLVTHENGLDELVKRVVGAGRLQVTDDTATSVRQTDVVLICVQTPVSGRGTPNLKHLASACRDVARGLSERKLVVVVSTVPPGTVRNLVANVLERESGLKCGSGFKLAYCPERILPGNTIEEFIKNDRLVGGFDTQSTAITVELFKSVVKGKILATTISNAELAKLAENTFRYINIAFANELALMCEEMGADIIEVMDLANSHPRVNIHKPGPGVGGPCLTKDPQLLLHPQKHQPLSSKLILWSEELNAFMADHTVGLVTGALKKKGEKVKNSCVAILGVAYKAEVSDTTNSPSERIIRKLMRLGAEVKVFDPYSNETFGAKSAADLEQAAKAADCLAIITDHKMFADLPFKKLKKLMKESPIIVDAKRIVDLGKAKREGFVCYGIGLGTE